MGRLEKDLVETVVLAELLVGFLGDPDVGVDIGGEGRVEPEAGTVGGPGAFGFCGVREVEEVVPVLVADALLKVELERGAVGLGGYQRGQEQDETKYLR